MRELTEDRAPVPTRARARLACAAAIVVAVIGLAGCAEPEPEGPTDEEIAAEAAAEARAARASVEELVSAAEARLSQTLGVAESTITIRNASPVADFPLSVNVSFMPDVAGSVLLDAASGLWATLTADGLTIESLVLNHEVNQWHKNTARWTTSEADPQTSGQIQLWARTVSTNPGAEVSLTSNSVDPLTLTVYNLVPRDDYRTSGMAYREIVDACVELGVDPAGARILISVGGYEMRQEASDPVSLDLIAAAEIADLQESAHLASVQSTADDVTVSFVAAREGDHDVVLSDAAKESLVLPFRVGGLLDERLRVVVRYQDDLSTQTLWSQE